MPLFGSGHEIVTSTTRPASPTIGQIIFETDTLSYRWYNGTAWEGVIPVGTIQPFAGATAPSGWLFCFGQTLNATTTPIYTDLYNVLGVTYGGSSISAFSVPDFRGRVAAGMDNMGGTDAGRLDIANTLGTTTGSQYHTLSIAELATHSHGVTASASVGVSGADDNNHTGNGDFVADSDAGYRTQRGVSVSVSIANNGSSTPHNNTQPTIITNYIIKI